MKWKTAGCIFHSVPVSRAHDVSSIWSPFKDAMYRALGLKIPLRTPCSDLQQVHHHRHLTQTAGTPPKTPHTNSQSTSMLCSIIPQTVWIGNVDSSVVWVLDHDWKVMCSSPCRSRVKTFFLRVNFLCRVLVWYPFHPPVTAVAHKRFQSFWQKCRWQVTPKYICGFAWTDEVTWHGAQLYGVHRTCWDGRTIKS